MNDQNKNNPIKIPRPSSAPILLALIGALLPGFTAHAQVATPNPAATIITTAPYTITRAGYYQLGANLSYAGNGATNDAIITINASNVTLDFGGHYITGPSSNPSSGLYGVYAYERGNLSVQNGTITYCYVGVELGGNNTATTLNINQRITNLLVSHCFYCGVYLYPAFNSEITDCRISYIGLNGGNSAIGIYGTQTDTVASGNLISDVTGGSNGGYGIQYTHDAINNRIKNITAPGGGVSCGILAATFSSGNTIDSAAIGIQDGKYQNNLTFDCQTSVAGGTDAGGNY